MTMTYRGDHIDFGTVAEGSVSNPTSGRKVFSDSGDSGALKSKDNLGTVRSLEGSQPGFHIDTVTVQFASATVDYGTCYAVRTTVGAYTLTLPTITSDDVGKIIEIVDAEGSAGTNNITIACGGSDILNGATSATIISAYNSVRLRPVIIGAQGIWMAV